MAGVSTVIAIAAAPRTLLQAAIAVRDQMKLFTNNPRCRSELQSRAEELIHLLRSAETVSTAASDLIHQDLQSVLQSLQSASAGQRHWLLDCACRCWKAADEHKDLQEAERKMDNLMTQVVFSKNILQLIPKISNESVQLPPCHVGLDRAANVLHFLQTSESEDLRVIGIYGKPGVGKTTLLNYIWQEASSKAPFCARAYAQIGEDTTSQTICKLQSDLWWQLCGKQVEFPSNDFGRGELNKHFHELKAQGRSLFLAIDNICEIDHLKKLLPFALTSENMPSSSCIAVASRNYGVVEALLSICRIQVKNSSQVFCFEPPCLNFEESKKVFADSAHMQYSDPKHQDLFNALVPLCGGLPLALTVLGTMFVREDRRERAQWELIKTQWTTLDADNEDTSPVTKALHLSYAKLKPSRQLSFLDIVSTYYGWSWEVVERIVGEDVMRDLKNSSLIFKVDGINECIPSAMREGWYPISNDSRYSYEPYMDHACVSMHDLTLRFGENIILNRNDLGYRWCPNQILKDLELPEASTIRNLILTHSVCDQEPLQYLLEANNLRTLVVLGERGPESLIQASFYEFTSGARQSFARQLQCLALYRWNSSRMLVEMKVSREIRDITLEYCDDILQLPDTPLPHLQRLRILGCLNLQGFSKSYVKEWHSLKYLFLRGCPGITTIPAELGDLPLLATVSVVDCQGLQEFPNLRHPQGPSSLVLFECHNLQVLGVICCPLQSLFIEDLPIQSLEVGNVTSLTQITVSRCLQLKELPACIFQNASSLQKIRLEHCEGLVKLPESMEGLRSLEEWTLVGCSNLTELPQQIEGVCALNQLQLALCRKLERLPGSICRIASQIKSLDLTDCEGLVELPHEIDGFCSLEELKLQQCKNITKLPDSICHISSLQILILTECENLVDLPEEIGRLSALRRLEIGNCRNLTRVPASISSLTRLEILVVRLCGRLAELPEQLGNLCSLKKLHLGPCTSLEKLPHSISKLTSLTMLIVFLCEKQMKLLQPLGSLCSLKSFHLMYYENLSELPESNFTGSSLDTLPVCNYEILAQCTGSKCQKSERLPESIWNMMSLENLHLNKFVSIVELPEGIGALRSLKELKLWGCQNLKKFPDSICSLSSLETLHVQDSVRLLELPEQLGRLSSLKSLTLCDSTMLSKLPESICRITALQSLHLINCWNLLKLPEWIGCLNRLQDLNMSGCKNLQKLPDSLCRMALLHTLNVGYCESLMELPEQIGGLHSLKRLRMEGCKNLSKLPDSLSELYMHCEISFPQHRLQIPVHNKI